jgi:hypothetical protein
VIAEIAFISYVWILGRRAVRAGLTGDLDAEQRGDLADVAG